MRSKNDVSTLRYARSFERLQLRTSGFKKTQHLRRGTDVAWVHMFSHEVVYITITYHMNYKNFVCQSLISQHHSDSTWSHGSGLKTSEFIVFRQLC